MLPLAHHSLLAALPAFGPVMVVCLVVAFHALRNRRRDDAKPEDPGGSETSG